MPNANEITSMSGSIEQPALHIQNAGDSRPRHHELAASERRLRVSDVILAERRPLLRVVVDDVVEQQVVHVSLGIRDSGLGIRRAACASRATRTPPGR